jgi:NADH-quinone oxidoreductase subunit F
MINEQDFSILTGGAPIASLKEYRSVGGLQAYEKVLQTAPDDVIDLIRRAGLRGRGGAGFPTATKWQGVRELKAQRKFVCCNGAEGEPGTFKDRYLLRYNPYQAIEGLAIAAHLIGAEMAYFCIKDKFEREKEAVSRALEELQAASTMADNIELILGPDEYLYGEEKGLLEVIEGGLPLPRRLPPYMHGLFAGAYGGPDGNPTSVNNVETLAHVPHIVLNGPDWFRSYGTSDTPGTMVFTISGDLRAPVVKELPLGLTLRQLIYDHAGGPETNRQVKAVFSGLASPVITPDKLDIATGFDSMRQAGTGLGSGGLIVYDDTACMVAVAAMFARFLYVESCNQCPPCKINLGEVSDLLAQILAGTSHAGDKRRIFESLEGAQSSNRCFLANSESLVISSILENYLADFSNHFIGRCPLRHDLILPKMTDFVAGQGFTYDTFYARKQPDWTYRGRAAAYV